LSFILQAQFPIKFIVRAKTTVQIPIIASLNGTTVGTWIDYAREIQQAGADALELNLYAIPANLQWTSEQVEQRYIDLLKAIKSVVAIPIAVKLSPYFSNLGNLAIRLADAGADALVLFNRFYQPDIDLETLAVQPKITFSHSEATRLPLRWIALLYGRLPVDFAATSGIHTAEDALKLLMAGAKVTMLCSALFQHGIAHIQTIEQEMRTWMRQHGYTSLLQLQGRLSHINAPNPGDLERVQYIQTLQSLPQEQLQGATPSYYFG
jgi:dihydroorotate dehydrogenase (fumarate)